MSIGRITVDLIAKTGSFDTDLNRSAKLAERRAKEIDRAFAKAGAAVGAGLVVAGGAITAVVMKTMDAAVQIERLAKVAGASTTDFQKLAFGARSVGIEQGKLSDILKDVNDKVGEFLQTGGGPMKDFFENIAPKVDITADAFRNLSGPQALQLYTDSLQKAGLNQQEMTFYLEALASDATALIPLLANGGAEFKRLGDAAARSGGIIGQDVVTAAAKLREQMDSLGLKIQSVSISIGSKAIPALDDLIGGFTDAWAESDKLKSELGKLATDSGLASWADTTALAIAGVSDQLSNGIRAFTQWRDGFADIGKLSQAWKDGRFLEEFAEQRSRAQGYWLGEPGTPYTDAVRNRINSRIGAASAGWRPEDEMYTPMPSGRTSSRPASGAVSEAMKARESLDGLIAESLARSNEMLAQQSERWLDVIDPMRQYTRQLDEIRGLVSAGSLSPEQGILAEFEVEEARQRWVDSLSEIGDKAQETGGRISEFTLEAARSIQGALGDGLYNVLDGNFDNIGDSFGNLMKRMAAEAAAAQLANVLFGDFDKSGKVGGLLGDSLKWLVGSIGGARATGGPVTAGVPYLVGERGPELFTPNTSGRVLPNHALGGSGPGVTINSTLNVAPGVSAAQVAMAMKQNNEQLEAQLAEGLRRGRYVAAQGGRDW